MKALKKKNSFVLCFLFVLVALANTSAMAATPAQIEASIEAGIKWLVAQQDPVTGAWSEYSPGGETGLALIKLEERAFELGYDSPFDPAYPYSQNVEDGLAYLFSIAKTIPISPQPAGDPDTNGNDIGVYVEGWERTYETGIALMAIAASESPGRIVNAPGSDVDGWTYAQVMQDMVDYMAFGQNDYSPGRGGWGYQENEQWQDMPGEWYSRSDNSCSGYAVLGLAYAEAPLFGFSCTIPGFVKSELDIWIDYIQNDVDGDAQDGGSGYEDPWDWVNVLKTGNLIFEMAFYGDGPGVPRVQDALDYLGRTWNDASQDPGWKGNPLDPWYPNPNYQAMYCIMKGLEYRGIDTVEVGAVERDWYADFADAIVNTQQPDDSWPSDYWGGQLLATEWALLTLEKAAPPVAEVTGQCILAGEEFEPVDLDETIDPNNPGTSPYTWTVTGNVVLVVNIDVENVMTVTYPGGWIGSEVLTVTCTDAAYRVTISTPTYTVCAVPVVLDIPDQSAPFEPFDLDDYLSGMAPEDVEWSASEPPEGWSVEIDADNVVTVTADSNDLVVSATITFTATSTICPCLEPSGSDDATFMAGAEACFVINDLKIETRTDKGDNHNELELKGTFDPEEAADLAVDEVTYLISDAEGHELSFFIPAGSFEKVGKGKKDERKFRYTSPEGSEPMIDAKFDFDKCKFELKAKAVWETEEMDTMDLSVMLQVGVDIGRDEVQAQRKLLEYKRKPKLNCCPKCKGIALLEVTSDQGIFVYEPEPGKEKLKANTVVDDDENGPVTIHTSCSKPIDVGDVFGPYTITNLVKIFDN